MSFARRTWSAFGALTLTGGLLIGCTGTAPEASDADADSSGAGDSSLTCNWDSPAVVVDAAVDPDAKDGELAELLVGAWQRTGYDIGEGYQMYSSDGESADRDYRFFFTADGEYLFCQNTPETDHGERRGDFTLEEATLDLSDDGSYTALSWNEENMTWKNHLSGATVYLQRR